MKFVVEQYVVALQVLLAFFLPRLPLLLVFHFLYLVQLLAVQVQNGQNFHQPIYLGMV